MHIIEDDVKRGGIQNPFYVIEDIKRRNIANEGNFSDTHKAQAQKLYKLMMEAFVCGHVYPPRFNISDMAVKVRLADTSTGRASDKMRPEYDILINWCKANGVTIKYTDRGNNINFHI